MVNYDGDLFFMEFGVIQTLRVLMSNSLLHCSQVHIHGSDESVKGFYIYITAQCRNSKLTHSLPE